MADFQNCLNSLILVFLSVFFIQENSNVLVECFFACFDILTIVPNLTFCKGYNLSKMANCQDCFISRNFFFQAAEIAAKIACVSL